MQDFTRLRVWQRAQKLAIEIYKDTDRLADSVHSDLAALLRSSVDAISTNIAEGARQPTPWLFARSLVQAISNTNDLITALATARKLGTIEVPRHVMLEMETIEIRRMLHALRIRILEWVRPKSLRT